MKVVESYAARSVEAEAISKLMGAVHFSIDRRLLARLTELLPLKVFVETGTYEGDSVHAATEFLR